MDKSKIVIARDQLMTAVGQVQQIACLVDGAVARLTGHSPIGVGQGFDRQSIDFSPFTAVEQATAAIQDIYHGLMEGPLAELAQIVGEDAGNQAVEPAPGYDTRDRSEDYRGAVDSAFSAESYRERQRRDAAERQKRKAIEAAQAGDIAKMFAPRAASRDIDPLEAAVITEQARPEAGALPFTPRLGGRRLTGTIASIGAFMNRAVEAEFKRQEAGAVVQQSAQQDDGPAPPSRALSFALRLADIDRQFQAAAGRPMTETELRATMDYMRDEPRSEE